MRERKKDELTIVAIVSSKSVGDMSNEVLGQDERVHEQVDFTIRILDTKVKIQEFLKC